MSNFRGRLLRAGVMAVVVTASALPVSAQLSVTLPDFVLNPEQAGQAFSIYMDNSSGTIPVLGNDFAIGVGSSTEQSPGPSIQDVEAKTGTIFDDPGYTETKDPANSHLYGAGIAPDVSNPAVQIAASPNQTLVATVTFSTVGVAPGTYTYTLHPPNVGPLAYYHENGSTLFPTLTDGHLTVVPEPSTYAMIAGLGCLGFGIMMRRKRA